MIINTFPPNRRIKSKYAAFDTETRVYIDGKILTDAQIRQKCRQYKIVNGERVYKYPPSWWREHARVECWAWIIYTPEGLAICESFDEWEETVTRLGIRYGWWYYAPFDFAVIDHATLSRGWKCVEKARNPREYSELSSDFGARYSMDMVFPYHKREKGDRSKRAKWKLTCYDLRNIVSGGLNLLLKSFDVRDENELPIRKLEMDYQSATGSEDDIKYMENDAKGLWWLVKRVDEHLKENYGGISIASGKPEVLTASGLAKKVYIRMLYPDERNDAYRLKRYQKEHRIWIETDAYFRERGLLEGGLVIINSDVRGKHLSIDSGYRSDINSEYPYYMRDMPILHGAPYTYKTLREAQEARGEGACYILEISSIHATVKPDMLPSWRDPVTGKVTPELITFEDSGNFCIFLEEYEELSNYWYEVHSVNIEKVIVYETKHEDALHTLIEREYARKTTARENGDAVTEYFAKLIMNGLGGKFSQNPRHIKKVRVMKDNIVRCVPVVRIDGKEIDALSDETGEGERVIEEDERTIMHVVQGARITCSGRVLLRKLAREICGDNVRGHLFYTDTDSLHTDVKPPDHLISKTELGKLKIENATPIKRACFLSPKCYYEIEENKEIEIHSKGVRIEEIKRLLSKRVSIKKIYTPGYYINSMCALTVPGGKMILPLPKRMERITSKNNIDEEY